MPEKQIKVEADFIVYGGTEAGIFAAVRGARLGLDTLLISESDYLYGFFPSLGAWETHYPGVRAPLSYEVEQKIIGYYRKNYGRDSRRFRDCVNLEDNNPMVTFEPHVAEKVLQELLDAESKLQVYFACPLVAAYREKGALNSLICQKEGNLIEFKAPCYADCSYTGDLGAAAGLKFFIGRESRTDYGEPHAGRLFTKWKKGRFPQASVEGKLNVLPTWTTTDPLDGSTGEGDNRIQDYSYRICLSCDPDNRIQPSKPSGYSRETYATLLLPPEEKAKLKLHFHHRWITHTLEEMVASDHLFHGHALPGNKRSWNATNLIGGGKDYADAEAEQRKCIEENHLQHALGLLYFLQNHSAVPPGIQQAALQWGLAKDEFINHKHLPPVMYIREARRFVGDYVYREQDCLRLEGLDRAPIHHDGIAFTEFALDSLPCSPERYEGSLPDGQFFEKDKTLPGSLPWRCLLPKGVTNLLIPTAPSVTHCAWGTVRQTACLLHLAEVCAYAVDMSFKQGKQLAGLSPLDLQIHLVQNGTMIAFFNDFDMAEPEPWKEAALLFGNRGFFADYDARPDEPLDAGVAKVWIQGVNTLIKEQPVKPNELAKRVKEAETVDNKNFLHIEGFCRELNMDLLADTGEECLTRKRALEILYRKILEKYPQSS